MPNVCTSLLARRLGTTTLAPTKEPPSVPEAISTQPNPEWKKGIFENALAEIVSLGKPPSHEAVHSVGIIGAGLAGLSAAYELTMRDYSVSIFEASERVGGRTWSDHDYAKPNSHHKIKNYRRHSNCADVGTLQSRVGPMVIATRSGIFRVRFCKSPTSEHPSEGCSQCLAEYCEGCRTEIRIKLWP
jgi:heterodisulfide reductase subunit A-like polyferredoxin